MRIQEIAKFLDGALVGEGETEILRVASLDTASENEISFFEKPELNEEAKQTKASCVLTPLNFKHQLPCPTIETKNPKLAFAKIAAELHPAERRNGWHKTASISDEADVRASFIGAFVSIGEKTIIGKTTQILEGTRIGNSVSIGKGSIIHPNCVIYNNAVIGDNCVIHGGTIIGADGFGFVRGEDGYVKFPQIGTVVIEDNVEIGANSCIDRGALGETRIGEGTKIDNLVQVAHNVQIGKRVVIASQTGISGSVVIEDDCVIGGQVGFGDHSTVKSGAVIGSQAGVLPGKIVREGVWWGTPVQPLSNYKRLNAHIKSLPRLKEQIKELKRLVSDLEKE